MKPHPLCINNQFYIIFSLPQLAEVLMHDDCIAVYRGGSDVMFFVVGDANEVSTKNDSLF